MTEFDQTYTEQDMRLCIGFSQTKTWTIISSFIIGIGKLHISHTFYRFFFMTGIEFSYISISFIIFLTRFQQHINFSVKKDIDVL